jgi:hypothetical protein
MPWENGEIEEEKALAAVRRREEEARAGAPTMASGLRILFIIFLYFLWLVQLFCCSAL